MFAHTLCMQGLALCAVAAAQTQTTCNADSCTESIAHRALLQTRTQQESEVGVVENLTRLSCKDPDFRIIDGQTFPVDRCWDVEIPADWTFHELPISGAHNAHANEDYHLFHIGAWATQQWNIFEQGRRGVRFFDIDVEGGCHTYHGYKVYGSVDRIMERIDLLLTDVCPNDVYFVNINDVKNISSEDATRCVVEAARRTSKKNELRSKGIQSSKLWMLESMNPYTDFEGKSTDIKTLHGTWWETKTWRDLRGSLIISTKRGQYESKNTEFTWTDGMPMCGPQGRSLQHTNKENLVVADHYAGLATFTQDWNVEVLSKIAADWVTYRTSEKEIMGPTVILADYVEGSGHHCCESSYLVLEMVYWLKDCMKPAVPAVSCTATVYQHQHFEGWRATFGPGSYDLDAAKKKGFVNDAATSIKVESGCQAVVYQHDHFTGWAANFSSGSYDKDAAQEKGMENDRATSIKVMQVVTPAPFAQPTPALMPVP